MTHKNLAVLNASEIDAVAGGGLSFAQIVQNTAILVSAGGASKAATVVSQVGNATTQIAPTLNTQGTLGGEVTPLQLLQLN
ncbi:hypothetical protein [Glaciimonas immobilis]|uniref:Bacteriocin n=1 Tax=Glaciimonas immobilis TaxID=728004 RepID=A0A840RUL8_9BURK|nr:hypothetical protein [Glaciimonas immobilis]KAF3997235.1 hypothetical protein HAV38_16420 [Glaciimonas immobilis]MBB5202287.1 hypothetical protein [Glaciimonas immobilis]